MTYDKILSRTASVLLIICTAIFTSCASFDSKSTHLLRDGNFGGIVSHLEPKFNNGAESSLRELSYLCNAYQHLKKYDKVFPCLDKLISGVNASEKTVKVAGLLGSALTLSAQTHLELGNYDKAIEEAKHSVDVINKDSALVRIMRIEPLLIMGPHMP